MFQPVQRTETLKDAGRERKGSMRFIHLSDLHIGKQLHQYSLKEDQEYILKEIVQYTKKLHPDAVLIAGDIYDKTVPSAEAVSIFDHFLTCLAQEEPQIPILLIGGNHDSAQRLDYASGILGKHRIYISGRAPRTEEECLKKVTLKDAYGEVDFWLLPFLKPGYVRQVFAPDIPDTYDDAVRRLLEREHIDFENRRNVIVTHQFYTGTGIKTQVCDSETFSVGGIDNVDAGVLMKFEYAALGHLHGAQSVGAEHIRYCGTPLKYSVSESNQKKMLHLVELGEKGRKVQIETYPLLPLRDVKKYRGTMEELLKTATEETKDDYVSITLTDEIDPYRPKEQLQNVFSHILEVRMDNARTRKMLKGVTEAVKISSPMELFGEFFAEMQGRGMTQKEAEAVEHILEKMEEE